MKKDNKNTLLIGITGGIAIYKICDLIRKLKKNDINIYVVMTKNAINFVTPLTFKILSENPVFIDNFSEIEDFSIPHISLSKICDLMLIAPATANIIAKIANGIADDLLSTLCLSFSKKILIAPAMNHFMYTNPIFQKNLNFLNQFEDKFKIIEAEKGELACGDEGLGRLANINTIAQIIINEFKSLKK